MGRIGKYESNVKPYIEQVKQWRRNGATDEQICEQLDISKDAFYNYAKKYAEFNDALKKSRADFVNDLKGELARIAFKHELKTTKIYTTVDSEGKEKKHTEVTSKEVDSDIAAIQILLKNLDRDNWADNPQLLKIKQQELELKKIYSTLFVPVIGDLRSQGKGTYTYAAELVTFVKSSLRTESVILYKDYSDSLMKNTAIKERCSQ